MEQQVQSEPQPQLIKSTNSHPLLICPDCTKHIPKLTLLPSDNHMSINLTCPCSQESKTKSLKDYLNEIKDTKPKTHSNCTAHTQQQAEKYCIDCSQWLCSKCCNDHQYKEKHILIEHELQLQCPTHKKKYIVYCNKCNLNLCPECQSDHPHQSLIPLDLNEPIELHQMDLLAKAQKQFTKTKDLMLHKANFRSRHTQYNTPITEQYNINKEINEDLIKLFLSIMSTTNELYTYPTYELNYLNKRIGINKKKYKERYGFEEFNSDYLDYTKYLKTTYVLENKLIGEYIKGLTGHTDKVCSLLELKDGRLASSSYDSTIRLWNTIAYECLAILAEHSDAVPSLIILKDDRLASGSYDKTIKLWNTTTKECTATLTGHTDKVNIIILLKDDRLASGSADETVRLWNTTTNELEEIITETYQNVLSLCELSDGKLAFGGNDLSIKLWNTTTKEYVKELRIKEYEVTFLTLLKDGRLASATSTSNNQRILLWNENTNQCISKLEGHIDKIKHIAQLSDGRLISCAEDNHMKIWDKNNNKSVSLLRGVKGYASCVIELKDGRLASASADMTVKFWDI